MLESPTTIHRAKGAIKGSDRAFRTTSGPMPLGSPIVRAILGNIVTDWSIKKIRYLDQRLLLAEAAGLGGYCNAIKISSLQDAVGNAWGNFAAQLDTLNAYSLANQGSGVAA